MEIYYSIVPDGAGSAYLNLYESQELVDWEQENLDEGWGESAEGRIAINGTDISCDDVITKEGFFLRMLLDDAEEEHRMDDFLEQFFPDGFPSFNVKIVGDRDYGIFIDGQLVFKDFAYPEKTATEEGAERTFTKINDFLNRDRG